MAQGDIYSIDVRLRNDPNYSNSPQTVSIVNDSIVLSAIISLSIESMSGGSDEYCELKLLNSNGEFMHRLFYRSGETGGKWELHELPIMKKLLLNAGEQLQFTAYANRGSGYSDSTYLNAKITLMEV